MSFSKHVKEELARHISPARHCQIAELAAMMHFCGQYGRDADGQYSIGFQTENEVVSRKGFTLLEKTYNIGADVLVNREQMEGFLNKIGDLDQPVDGLEFVCPSEAKAEQLVQILADFNIEGKVILRKKYYVVYLKEGESIVDLLNVCEAPVALMEFENLRILKEMRNSINRRVNCEAANITKTVNAAARQIEDIEYIRDHGGLDRLPPNLKQMAEVRLENPDMPLKELGECLDPPVGKSGVNHRLRKLSEYAERLRI